MVLFWLIQYIYNSFLKLSKPLEEKIFKINIAHSKLSRLIVIDLCIIKLSFIFSLLQMLPRFVNVHKNFFTYFHGPGSLIFNLLLKVTSKCLSLDVFENYIKWAVQNYFLLNIDSKLCIDATVQSWENYCFWGRSIESLCSIKIIIVISQLSRVTILCNTSKWP